MYALECYQGMPFFWCVRPRMKIMLLYVCEDINDVRELSKHSSISNSGINRRGIASAFVKEITSSYEGQDAHE